MTFDQLEFNQFLIQAKKYTYASQGDEASVVPTLNGSKQLEFRKGDYFYRDIYFGFEYFIGQELIEYKNIPIWSMVYSGGIIQNNHTDIQIVDIYQFLRKALRLIESNNSYRGPEIYEEDKFIYLNKVHGKLNNFWGYETININNHNVYELRYNGGFLR